MLDPKLAKTLADFRANGGHFRDCVAYFGINTESDHYASKAKELYSEESTVVIDDRTVLAPSDDGSYVMAWVWVGKSDLEN